MVNPQMAEPSPQVAEPAPALNRLGIPEVVIDRSHTFPPAFPLAPVSITDAELRGEVVVLSVSYRAGCTEHSFTLVTDTGYYESYPPTKLLYLLPKELNDPCLAPVEEQLAFDVSPVKRMYWRDHGGRAGTVFLWICGYPDQCRSLPYTFGTRPLG